MSKYYGNQKYVDELVSHYNVKNSATREHHKIVELAPQDRVIELVSGSSSDVIVSSVTPTPPVFQDFTLTPEDRVAQYRVDYPIPNCCPLTRPGVPSNLIIISGSAVLIWNGDNCRNEDGFVVEKSTNGATYVQYVTKSANIVTHTDYNVSVDNSYWYRVFAYNSAGNSDYSNTASITFYNLTIAGFTYTTSSQYAPFTTSFTNTSISASSYLWNFGDSSPTTSSVNASHIYNTGSFTASLQATGPRNSDITSSVISCSAAPVPVGCSINFNNFVWEDTSVSIVGGGSGSYSASGNSFNYGLYAPAIAFDSTTIEASSSLLYNGPAVSCSAHISYSFSGPADESGGNIQTPVFVIYMTIPGSPYGPPDTVLTASGEYDVRFVIPDTVGSPVEIGMHIQGSTGLQGVAESSFIVSGSFFSCVV